MSRFCLEKGNGHCNVLNVFLRLRLQVYPLHSSVTLEEQNGVFLSPVPWYRKVKAADFTPFAIWEISVWGIWLFTCILL